MCDTFAIGTSMAPGGNHIFAKNSDREPDEAHIVISLPRREYAQNETVTCTYITIPQSVKSNAVLLCKPSWIWGAEMGVNEKGLVIGNEALFTKVKPEKKSGLIGMDLLRLALERADGTDEATEIIINLLQRYGQGGACGYRDKSFVYMNSYLLMDRKGIVILETVGRDYAVRSHKDYAVISNGITIGDDWDRSSLVRGADFKTYNDFLITHFSGSKQRRGYITERIVGCPKCLGIQEIFDILRGHKKAYPFHGINHDVCMHAADPFIRRSHTTGSLVVELDRSSGYRIFVTAGSSPCLTTFKPVLPAEMPDRVDKGGCEYGSDSFWWRHEAFRIHAEMRLSKVRDAILQDIREIENYYCQSIQMYQWDSSDDELVRACHEAFIRSSMLDAKWLQKMKRIDKDPLPVHNTYWSMVAGRSGIPLV